MCSVVVFSLHIAYVSAYTETNYAKLTGFQTWFGVATKLTRRSVHSFVSAVVTELAEVLGQYVL